MQVLYMESPPLPQMGGLKFSTLLGGQQGFLYLGDGGSLSPTGQKLLTPPTGKSLPSRPPTKFLFPSPKVRFP